MEPWHEFLKRTARWTEEQLGKAGQKEWLASWRTRQWKWACKLMTQDKGKWSADCTLWQPLVHSSYPCRRAKARPKKRWAQDIEDFLGKEFPDEQRDWKAMAKDKDTWMKLTSKFVANFTLDTVVPQEATSGWNEKVALNPDDTVQKE